MSYVSDLFVFFQCPYPLLSPRLPSMFVKNPTRRQPVVLDRRKSIMSLLSQSCPVSPAVLPSPSPAAKRKLGASDLKDFAGQSFPSFSHSKSTKPNALDATSKSAVLPGSQHKISTGTAAGSSPVNAVTTSDASGTHVKSEVSGVGMDVPSSTDLDQLFDDAGLNMSNLCPSTE